jgi:hypothetical protein
MLINPGCFIKRGCRIFPQKAISSPVVNRQDLEYLLLVWFQGSLSTAYANQHFLGDSIQRMPKAFIVELISQV